MQFKIQNNNEYGPDVWHAMRMLRIPDSPQLDFINWVYFVSFLYFTVA